ncbi:hypothetical protein O6H91_03G068900 [Diphasiastrum complanatum]|uniref:Uncharacterized protein n=1 Tax=Diphasiastrum complanatum TaxID=34168 RepID=A0ACC2E7G6_DIPCM|nr:hypothetical protein O6H91_03G068900 [Diphasiastrum complanatum]
MEFCPNCANLLLVESASRGRELRFFCPTCPYIFPIKHTIVRKAPLVRKEVDDVLGGEKAWKNVDRTRVTCPKCSHGLAYFMQIQIRSADEPMTTFYKCSSKNCSFQWREG